MLKIFEAHPASSQMHYCIERIFSIREKDPLEENWPQFWIGASLSITNSDSPTQQVFLVLKSPTLAA
jgi:hypothetical protein